MTIPLVKEADRATCEKTAPWPDFIGAEIREGDTIIHPSGQSGVVAFKPERKTATDQWVVNYGDGVESRLCLQIGDKGRATVQSGARE